MKKKTIIKIIFVLLILFEIAIIILLSKKNLSEVDKIRDQDSFIMKSNNLVRAYEYKPNSWVRTFRVNSYGFRDKEWNLKKDSDYRILIIGDSVTLSWDSPITLSEFLEQILNTNSESSFEVLNMGVEGSSTIQELEVLKDIGLQFKPDIVLLQYTLNDLELPAHYLLNEEETIQRNQLIKEEYGLLCDYETQKNMFIDFDLSKYYDDCHLNLLNKSFVLFKESSLKNNFVPMIIITPYNDSNITTPLTKIVEDISNKNNITTLNLVYYLEKNEQKQKLFVDEIHLGEEGVFFMAKKINETFFKKNII